MGMITVNQLGKAYKQYPRRLSRLVEWFLPSNKPRHSLKWVMQDVSFSILPGESVAIMGVNGAGKSTLLKMITGTTKATTGSIKVTGRVAALLELGMGFHPDFTGRQNVHMAGQLLGLSVSELAKLMPEIESFAEIGDYIDQPLRVYSSGMQMRLAFSVATVTRPDILIVDEALSVGDAYFQAKCYQRIKTFKENGTTLLLVSHSAGDVVKHCERAILLKEGRVELDGSSREVSNRYLDELFGRGKSNSPNKNLGGSFEGGFISSEFDIMDDAAAIDVFHTRSGYRKEEHRWGCGGAVIQDYVIVANSQKYPSHIESNTVADFYFKAQFDAEFDNIIPGFLIKTLEGIFLYGTNSILSTKQSEKISVKAGETKVFRFSLPISVNEGHYLISFGVSAGDSPGELVPLDRRYDSILLHVTRSIPFWGITDFNAQFECIETKIRTITND